jgi:thiol-disulfide isomerase/thioredoxin
VSFIDLFSFSDSLRIIQMQTAKSQQSQQQESTVYKVHDYGTFRELVSSGLTIIDFSATWCGPCRKIAPIYEVFATEYTKLIPELKFLKVDVDEVPMAAQGVAGLPTFQFWVDNQRVDCLTVMGASVEKLRTGINDLLKGNYVLPVEEVAVKGQGQGQGQGSTQDPVMEVIQEVPLRRSSSAGLRLKSKAKQPQQSPQAPQVQQTVGQEPSESIQLEQDF